MYIGRVRVGEATWNYHGVENDTRGNESPYRKKEMGRGIIMSLKRNDTRKKNDEEGICHNVKTT